MKTTIPGIIFLRQVAEYCEVTCLLDDVICKDEVFNLSANNWLKAGNYENDILLFYTFLITFGVLHHVRFHLDTCHS